MLCTCESLLSCFIFTIIIIIWCFCMCQNDKGILDDNFWLRPIFLRGVTWKKKNLFILSTPWKKILDPRLQTDRRYCLFLKTYNFKFFLDIRKSFLVLLELAERCITPIVWEWIWLTRKSEIFWRNIMHNINISWSTFLCVSSIGNQLRMASLIKRIQSNLAIFAMESRLLHYFVVFFLKNKINT